MKDLVNYIMLRAAERQSACKTGKFNSANFSAAFCQVTGVKQMLDGETVYAILHGRDDVDRDGNSYWRLRQQPTET